MFDWGITADIHLDLYKDKEYTQSGLPLKLEEILNTFKNMCDFLIERKINKVAILGDVNHIKQYAAVDAFSIFKSILESYQSLTFYVIPGNHDMTSKEGTRTAIDLLRGPENVVAMNKPTVFGNITFVPYADVSKIPDLEPTDILMSHLGLSDAVLSNGTSIRSNLKSSDLKKWKKVFLGHYHKPQEYYPGTLIPLTRAEFGEEKRFIIFDSESLETESIPTSGYRKYYEIVLDEEGTVNSKLEEAKNLKKSGNFVVVRNRLKEVLTDQIEDISIIDEYEEEFQSRGLDSKMNDKEQMERYLEIERIPEDEREEYLNIGLKLINLNKG
jgi:DNA repair exonuclease SbcCD nuclease subunit